MQKSRGKYLFAKHRMPQNLWRASVCCWWNLSCLFILSDMQRWRAGAAQFPTPSQRRGACPAQPELAAKIGLCCFLFKTQPRTVEYTKIRMPRRMRSALIFFSAFCWDWAAVWRGQWHCSPGGDGEVFCCLLTVQTHSSVGLGTKHLQVRNPPGK